MTDSSTSTPPWFALDAAAAAEQLGTDLEVGLDSVTASSRLSEYGSNEIHSEPPPSVLEVALAQLRNPMYLMLIAVAAVSFLVGEIPTGILVSVLVIANTISGTRQELKARATVDALSDLQVPTARVVRGGATQEIPASGLVPGDVVLVEAGDITPADGRLFRSATLEAQEASLTGESAPIPKDPATLLSDTVVLGDRSNMLFQNTSITRGSGAMVVTETGMSTQMGRIASMLSSVKRSKSPLQQELDGLTKVLGFVAWAAVAVITIVGVSRGVELNELLLLGTAMAIAAIPTGMPTLVMAMLAHGSSQLAAARAVVRNLSDVETLGSTSAINTDKTGTLTMNQMMVSRLFHGGSWFTVEGNGYNKVGAIRAVAGEPAHDFTRMGYALALDSDAVVSDSGDVIGDPTEAALVVLAAKLGIDAEDTRRAYPRLAEVPFDSAYKFMSTVHRVPVDGTDRLILLTKGGPDVVLARCTEVSNRDGTFGQVEDALDDIMAANQELGSQGLRVLSLASRLIDPADEDAVLADPMSFVTGLRFHALIGMIDPLRPSSKEAVATALGAGIDVRMITGDHAVTANAIGKELGLAPGAISGPDFRAMSDEDVVGNLDQLHVFGRVAPQDKLRLVELMQGEGTIVAMTGDAVNDAAALKQADIGVAMGSGSEVTKQAAKMVLTDDNFGTLITAVEIGRAIYQQIRLYVRYQMSQLLSLVSLFLAATVLNIAEGVALTPLMVLFINFLVNTAPVAVILVEPRSPELMRQPPRDPSIPLANRGEMVKWAIYGGALFLAALVPLVWGPDEPSGTAATASMTMAFATLAFGTLLTGLSVRRDVASGLTGPILKAVGILSISGILTIWATEGGFFQQLLTTQALTINQWGAVVALALAVLVVVEFEKLVRRRRAERSDGQLT